MTTPFNSDFIPAGAQPYFAAYPNILVVEDSRGMAQVFLEILGNIGFSVTVVPDGPTALKILKQQPVDFIILDLWLLFMSGFEIYQKLQANPATKKIPVLFITGRSDLLKKAIGLGILHVLDKPFTEDELLEAILVVLRHHSAPDSSVT
jgi:DNA-binding response OmpR family regulator